MVVSADEHPLRHSSEQPDQNSQLRYPEEWLDAFDEDGGLALILEVSDIKAAARATGGAVSDTGDSLIVPPERASGVIVKFAT